MFSAPNQVVSKKKVFTEIETDFSAEIGNSNVFSAQKQVVSKKKRSSPKLRLIFRSKSEILTYFHSESRHLLHNFGTRFSLGGAVFKFSSKIGLKSTKNVRFCILHKPMGGARAPPWLRYCIYRVAIYILRFCVYLFVFRIRALHMYLPIKIFNVRKSE